MQSPPACRAAVLLYTARNRLTLMLQQSERVSNCNVSHERGDTMGRASGKLCAIAPIVRSGGGGASHHMQAAKFKTQPLLNPFRLSETSLSRRVRSGRALPLTPAAVGQPAARARQRAI